MHRTEGADNISNLFNDGPPGTVVEQDWLNAVQEEICYVIEQAGLTLKTAATETRDQLKAAIDVMIQAEFPVPVTKGGTGAVSLTDGGILLGSGIGAITALGQAGNGEIPIGSVGADPVIAAILGTANEITVTNGAGSIILSLPAVSKFTPQNIWIPAGALIPHETNGALAGTYEYAANDVLRDYFAFDDATEEYISFNIEMPEGWDLGTFKAKFHWSPSKTDASATAGETCEWGIAARAYSDGDALDAAFGAVQVISDTVLANEEDTMHKSGATPAVTIGGTPALGDLTTFRVERNVGGADNMVGDAWLFGVMLQITINQVVAAW